MEIKKYALIRQGREYWVHEGMKVTLDKINKVKNNQEIILSDRACFVDNDQLFVHQEYDVVCEVIKELIKGEKVLCYKYKRRARSRRLKGFRRQGTLLQVKSINLKNIESNTVIPEKKEKISKGGK